MDPVHEWLYLSGRGGGVSVVDAVTGSELALIPMAAASGFALSRDRSKLYGLGGGVVQEVDTASRTVTKTLSLPPMEGAYGIALSPDGSELALGWMGPIPTFGTGVRLLKVAADIEIEGTLSASDRSIVQLQSPTYTDDGRVVLLDPY